MNVSPFYNFQFTMPNGMLTTDAQNFMTLINQAMQGALSDNGWTFPSVTADELTAAEPNMPDGTGWYENEAHEIVFKINGALRKVTTTAYP